MEYVKPVTSVLLGRELVIGRLAVATIAGMNV